MSTISLATRVFCAFLTVGYVIGVLDISDYTPDNPFAKCFRDQAMKTVHSKCWARKSDSYTGEGYIKKHQHLRYIVERCGASVPWDGTSNYAIVRMDLRNVANYGNWTRVTGIAQVGDILVDEHHISIIVDLGKRGYKTVNGIQITKPGNESHWRAIVDWFGCGRWKDIPSGHDVTVVENPPSEQDLGSSCNPTPSANMQLTTKNRAYFELVRARLGKVQVVQRYHGKDPILLRYIPATTPGDLECNDCNCYCKGGLLTQTSTPQENGCHPWDWWSGIQVFNNWIANFEECCSAHDSCFGTCGKSRDDCNKEFYKCAVEKCKTNFSYPYQKWTCIKKAKDFRDAIEPSYYKTAQRDHCQCE